MIQFFKGERDIYYAVLSSSVLSVAEKKKLKWLFSGKLCRVKVIKGIFLGYRLEMVSPWSTNVVDICKNMGIAKVKRIEKFQKIKDKNEQHDRMLQAIYHNLGQDIFTVKNKPQEVEFIENIEKYNNEQGLALNPNEIKYLESLSRELKRKLTDSEIYGFSQVNSEHCRHKIFNGTFILNGNKEFESLFEMIKKTTINKSKHIISAYTDNVAFYSGPDADIFTVKKPDRSDYFIIKKSKTALSLKAETHNFPTTVESFYGGSTGSGGEIRDRMAGGRGSIPLAGIAVYCTPYPRHKKMNPWEKKIKPRQWLYQTPQQILLKASNGASDFGNKFGQPLICGSILTFEHAENNEIFSYDKVIMLAGGVGYTRLKYANKQTGKKGDLLIMMGGDNYRIGMGGGAVSSVTTGEMSNIIELNAVQRANPEMQKRVFNVIRSLVEGNFNPIISVHDHGAGGHLNCFTEMVEKNGGIIDIKKLPVGDPSLSEREIICNESQERMGLLIKPVNLNYVETIAKRERAPVYVIGKLTSDKKLIFKSEGKINPINLQLNSLLVHPPKIIISDNSVERKFFEPEYKLSDFIIYLENVLKLESVGCKDWLTNKVDRSVTGLIATQQCCGQLQLPLNNVGVCAIDYTGSGGVAVSVGLAPAVQLIDSAAGSKLALAKALTNLIWAPLKHGLSGVSLSANWMWASDKSGEAVRLYNAVKGLTDFAVELGIPVPTGKDSLFMTQKYTDGTTVVSPGTVIVTASAEVSDVKKTVQPVLKHDYYSSLILIRFTDDNFELGGSALYQTLNAIGNKTPLLSDEKKFARVFDVIQKLIINGHILSGHDIGSGGLITTLFEMCFADNEIGMDLNISSIPETDITKILFSENPGVVIQVNEPKPVIDELIRKNVEFYVIGKPIRERVIKIIKNISYEFFDINHWRKVWFTPSYKMERLQSNVKSARQRLLNFDKQVLNFSFPEIFIRRNKTIKYERPKLSSRSKPKAAIIREQGVNGDREMAYALFYAGFEVKDIHMTDLISGAETLEDVNFIVFVGGFSNSDVLGSAKGWAGAFLFNIKAKTSLYNFYKREDTLSLGVCNGCQLMIELGLITSKVQLNPKMKMNKSGKFESGFICVDIMETNSIMLEPVKGCRLGVWIAHGEGRFSFPKNEKYYNICMKYTYDTLPGNPNGSQYSAAGICSDDGRHLAIMPHIERSVFTWQWGYYPDNYEKNTVTPWILAYDAARAWILKQIKTRA